MLIIPIRLDPDDSSVDMAKKIYGGFEVGQSCSIKGAIGQEVLDHLFALDQHENVQLLASGRTKRKYKYLPNAIGGGIAHKIFRWQRVDKDKYTIWRYQ